LESKVQRQNLEHARKARTSEAEPAVVVVVLAPCSEAGLVEALAFAASDNLAAAVVVVEVGLAVAAVIHIREKEVHERRVVTAVAEGVHVVVEAVAAVDADAPQAMQVQRREGRRAAVGLLLLLVWEGSSLLL